MNNKELSIVLRELACSQKTPLCAEWTEAWKDDSAIDELLDKFVKGFDFCIKNDYPTLDFSRKHFSDKKEILHRHNIYFDEEVNIENANSGTYIFVGDCTGTIVFKGFSVGAIYLRHNCKIKVVADENSKVFVRMYDNSMCEKEVGRFAHCSVLDRKKN